MDFSSIENLITFTKDLLQGNLEAFIKSQPKPDLNEGPVKIAVGHTFAQLITDSGRDIFIKFFSPECQHCQRLEPVWNELGNKMIEENVDIVKIDATANDWPQYLYEVTAFPTIYWKSANSVRPVKYSGSRTLDGFIKFVSQFATEELKGWDRKGKPKRLTK